MKNTRPMLEAALFIVIALILTRFGLRLWPQGGSINFFMVPLIVYAVRWGLRWGLLAGLAFGILNIFFGSALYHPLSGLLDYIIPGMAFGLAGLFRGKTAVYLGALVGGTVTLLSHIASGILIFAHFMPSEFLGLNMSNIWFYSFLYNATYIIPNIIFAIIILAIMHKPLKAYFTRVQS